MTAFFVVAATLCALVAGWLTRPLWSGGRRAQCLAAGLCVFVCAFAAAGHLALRTAAATDEATDPELAALLAEAAARAQARPDDATALADQAYALALKQAPHDDGEPARLVERALALEPDNRKALALAGTMAFQRHDYARAIRHWETLARIEPPGSPVAQRLAASLAQARQRAAR